MLRVVEAAREVGILPENLTFVEPQEAGFMPREFVLYLCTGSQGERRRLPASRAMNTAISRCPKATR
ncbi:MAG: hypothetical protein R3C54_14590 [Parvularculaceae bacterium]